MDSLCGAAPSGPGLNARGPVQRSMVAQLLQVLDFDLFHYSYQHASEPGFRQAGLLLLHRH